MVVLYLPSTSPRKSSSNNLPPRGRDHPVTMVSLFLRYSHEWHGSAGKGGTGDGYLRLEEAAAQASALHLDKVR